MEFTFNYAPSITNDDHSILVDNVHSLDEMMDHLVDDASFVLDHPSYNPLLLDHKLLKDLGVEDKLLGQSRFSSFAPKKYFLNNFF